MRLALLLLCSCGRIEDVRAPPDDSGMIDSDSQCFEGRATTITTLDPSLDASCRPYTDGPGTSHTSCMPNWRAPAGRPLVLHTIPPCASGKCGAPGHDPRQFKCDVHVECGEHPRITLDLRGTFCGARVGPCNDDCSLQHYPCNVPPLAAGDYAIVDAAHPDSDAVVIHVVETTELIPTSCP